MLATDVEVMLEDTALSFILLMVETLVKAYKFSLSYVTLRSNTVCACALSILCASASFLTSSGWRSCSASQRKLRFSIHV